jgi:pyrroline-5-carboxylate reductase
MRDERRIAILGAGKLGEALISGIVSSGFRDAGEVVAADVRESRLEELAQRYGIQGTLSPADAIATAGLVKPQDFAALLATIGPLLGADQTVLSVAAGITTAGIEAGIAAAVPVVRAMPNLPATVHEGMAGICPGAHAGELHLAAAEAVLRSVGSVVRVAEKHMDAVTAISGSGPAYFALLAESMIEAGLLLGLSREVSSELVVQTMLGTATLLRDEKLHPVELREMVTSPGGTTIAAIRELEVAGVRAAFFNAIQAAMTRSAELAGGK